MTEKIVKVIKAFYAAKCVNHYYWMHTDGDGDEYSHNRVSIENIQKIIALMTGYSISKQFVDYDSQFHRAFIERFDDGKVNVIYVLETEEAWRRFATVKELCHILVDTPDTYQPDPEKTILYMKDGGMSFLDERASPEHDSEHMAEIIAMELIYPLEYRREDKLRLEDGDELEDIAQERLVPPKYISHGTNAGWISTCEKIWSNLADVDPVNLNHLL